MSDADNLANRIVKYGWLKQGYYQLSSGKHSNYYIDLRPCILNSKFLHLPVICLMEILKEKVRVQHEDLLCGVITSGLILMGEILQRVSGSLGIPDLSGIYCRTEHRVHGQGRDIEGEYTEGQAVILIDDVATSGASLAKVIKILHQNGLKVKAALVVVDRNEGAKELLALMDVPLYSVLEVGRNFPQYVDYEPEEN